MRALRLVMVLIFFALFINGCAGCGETAGAGEICNPDISEACEEHQYGLSCIEDRDGDFRCLHEPGGRCEPGAELCAPGAECSEGDDEVHRCYLTASAVCDPDEDHCRSGLVCAQVEEEEDYQCHPEVLVQGLVFDAESLEPIEGAQIIAFNEEGSALSDVAVSNADGFYSLSLPALRNSDGEPLRQFFTLRASARDYQTFPGGLRTAQPIDASNNSEDEGFYVIDTAQTDLALIALPEEEQGHPSIRGVVDIEGGLGGVLVIAEADSNTGFSGVSARNGEFTIFNVAPGSYEVRGYIADYQIEPETVEMGSERVEDVVLRRSEHGTQTLNGQVQINAHGSLNTTVVLMVASTFDEVSVRGEVPAGLRAPRSGDPNVKNHWTIEGVPAGEYYVLAGFENDQLVRDPNEGVSGTDLVRITVPAEEGTMTVTPSFKVTSALATVSPGHDGPEGLSERPTLIWGRYSNAQHYSVVVFDSYGDIVWSQEDIPQPGGGANIEVNYEGPFEEGMYYQFRAVAYHTGSAISTTEVLRGVFYRQ